MTILANSEDPDEMLHNAALHQGLYCLVRQNWFSEKEIQFYLEIITCDPLMYKMGPSKCIESNQNEESISA